MTIIPKSIIEEVQKIQENFLWNKTNPKISNSKLTGKYENPKIKNSTFTGEYEWGGLKKVDIDTTLSTIRISWSGRQLSSMENYFFKND